MTPSVSSGADRELTEGAVFYVREGGAEVGLAFVAEFERALDLLCRHPQLGVPWRNNRRRFPLRKFPRPGETTAGVFHCASFPTASSTICGTRSSA